MRLDDLARSATDALVERSTPDVDTGLEDLKRLRGRRNAGRVLAAGLAAAVVAGGWAVVSEPDATPEPAEPVVRNGALVVASDGAVTVVQGGDGMSLRPEDLEQFSDLSFTADGEELVYQNRDRQIVARDVETREVRVLGECGTYSCPKAALSPDERWLAMPDIEGVLLSRVGGEERRRLTDLGVLLDIAWSPDGGRLAVTGSEGLQVVPLDGSPRTTVLPVDRKNVLREIAWSPDGTTIAFIEVRPRGPEKDFKPMQHFLRIVPADAHDAVSLADLGDCYCHGLSPPDFAWAPDGSALAYTRLIGPGTNARPGGIHLIRPDGTGHERVVSFGGGSLAWQPLVTAD